MLQFKTITLCDKEWVDKIVFSEDSPSADYNFGNIYIWDKSFRQLVCPFEGRMMTKQRYEGHPSFAFPIGSGPLRPAIEPLREIAAFKGYPFRLHGVTEKHRAQLEEEYPGGFEFTEDTDYADYIYSAEKLATYAGKALHGKKNHCNRFEAEHPDFKTQRVTPEPIPLCREMTEKRYEAHDWNEKIEYEKIAIARAFDCFSETGMDGLLLVENGEVLAFSLGARMNERYYDVCFEKAFSAINGAYAMINREFSRMIAEKYPAVAYLNREDDMGEPGLRKAKESYQPTLLLEKFTADWKVKI